MKRLKVLWRVLAGELASWCHTSASRDYETVSVRVRNEGLSFLTITLPAFGKEFERALEQRQVDPSSFPGFHKEKKGPLPRFLGGFLNQVFDSDSGRLLDEPNIDCIFAVRQLTLVFQKILLPCSQEREEDAIAKFIQCEKEMEASLGVPAELSSQFSRIAALLFEDLFSKVENQLYKGDTLRPRHGPGATADGLRGNSKFDQSEWPVKLEEGFFPYGDYVLPNWRYASELEHVDFLEPGTERPVKVTLVPKTLKTPRIIAIEPTCMQYVQQALAGEIIGPLESQRIGENRRYNVVQGQIGFTDQMPNRQLAREGSLAGKVATLDLSEASDRVSTRHVELLLSRWPLLQEAVMSCRSSKAEVPGYGVITLAKFASMGSALTFPIEAMVFLTAVYCGIENALNRRLRRHDVESFRRSVRVYGDDIVVPVDYVSHVIQSLEDLEFQVNKGKSFWNGKFRESCGGDFYDGVDVTPVRVRREFPQSRADANEVVSLVAMRNLMYQRGLWQTTRFLDRQIGKFLPHFPIVEETSTLLGRHSFLGYTTERLCNKLHRPLVKGYVAYSISPISNLDGIGALTKWFLKTGEEPFARDHLLRQGRPVAVDIKLRWAPPY